MNVLSLFDGMSCGQLALTELGISYNNYFASEIDKWAIKVTQHNYPNTQQLGDVNNWEEWDIDWGSIDLVLAGSPCQGFSVAGKGLAFDDPRSALFFKFIDVWGCVLKHNPKAKFLLENVRMKREFQDVITRYMGVRPITLNSNVMSAQNRLRCYWTNIKGVTVPQDEGLLLKDIVHEYRDDDIDLADFMVPLDKSLVILEKEVESG